MTTPSREARDTGRVVVEGELRCTHCRQALVRRGTHHMPKVDLIAGAELVPDAESLHYDGDHDLPAAAMDDDRDRAVGVGTQLRTNRDTVRNLRAVGHPDPRVLAAR